MPKAAIKGYSTVCAWAYCETSSVHHCFWGLAGQPVLSSSRPGIKSHPVISVPGITQGLSRNVPRPLCGSVGPCSTRSYLAEG